MLRFTVGLAGNGEVSRFIRGAVVVMSVAESLADGKSFCNKQTHVEQTGIGLRDDKPRQQMICGDKRYDRGASESRSTIAFAQLVFNENAGCETSSWSYLLKHGAPCHPDVNVL